VTPTPAGALLFERARAILSDIEETARQVRELGSGAQSHVVLGVTPSMVLLLGPDLLLRASQELPGVTVSLVEERSPVLLEALESGHLDVAFLYNASERRNLRRHALIEEDLLFVTAPGAAGDGEGPLSLAQALDHELVIAGERGVIRKIVEAEAARLSLNLRLAYEVHSIRSMKSLVAQGAAASIVPWSLAADELRSGVLRARRIDRPALTRTMYMVEPASRRQFAAGSPVRLFLERTSERMLELIGPYARSLR